MTKTMLQARK